MPLEVFIVTARRAEQNKIIQINLTGLKIPTDTAVRGGLELGETDLQVQRFKPLGLAFTQSVESNYNFV